MAARELMPLLAGEIRPAMVEAVRRCREHLVTACLTNNWVSFDDFPADGRAGGRDEALGPVRPRHRVEQGRASASPTRASTSWPATTCGVEPDEVVFLDDLGVNLKPAAAMGMTTIKVVDPADALAQLEQVVGFPLG